jgi:hypothetical protein
MNTDENTLKPLFEMDQKKAKIRKYWLIATILLLVVIPQLSFAFLAFVFKIPVSLVIVWQLTTGVASLSSLWIIWHCAYKKPGTKWLTCWLVCAPFYFLQTLLQLLRDPWNGWFAGMAVFDLLCYVGWYVLSLKLRKINKQLQANSSPEYAQAVRDLREASTIEVLNDHFVNLSAKWPKLEYTSSKEYRRRKLELSKMC